MNEILVRRSKDGNVILLARAIPALRNKYRRRGVHSRRSACHAARTLIPDARTAGGAPLYGRSDAPTTIVVFSDLECPYCKRHDARLRELVEKRSDIRIVWRSKPLPMHAHARLAAKAAIAADQQGKLDVLVKAMFDHQDALDRASLESYAGGAGLDRGRFVLDLDSAETEARLSADEALAAKLGVKGTPTSFVEGRRIVGAQPISTFEGAALRAAEARR